MPASLRRVRSRKPRPPGTKIFDWFGRSAPALSISEIDGRRFCSAMSDSRPDFPTLTSLIAPPLTVASLAVIRHSTPLTTPTPPITLAPAAWPGTSLPARGHSSRKYESRSRSSSTRCRGKSLPAATWRLLYLSPPPAVASRRAAVSLATAARPAAWFRWKSSALRSTWERRIGYGCSGIGAAPS
jgi:hypothetical protein